MIHSYVFLTNDEKKIIFEGLLGCLHLLLIIPYLLQIISYTLIQIQPPREHALVDFCSSHLFIITTFHKTIHMLNNNSFFFWETITSTDVMSCVNDDYNIYAL